MHQYNGNRTSTGTYQIYMNGICDWCYTLNVPELLVNKIGFACNFIANEEPNSNGILDFERIFYHAIHCPFPMRSEHAIALNLTEFISWCFPFFIEMNYFWFWKWFFSVKKMQTIPWIWHGKHYHNISNLFHISHES